MRRGKARETRRGAAAAHEAARRRAGARKRVGRRQQMAPREGPTSSTAALQARSLARLGGAHMALLAPMALAALGSRAHVARRPASLQVRGPLCRRTAAAPRLRAAPACACCWWRALPRPGRLGAATPALGRWPRVSLATRRGWHGPCGRLPPRALARAGWARLATLGALRWRLRSGLWPASRLQKSKPLQASADALSRRRRATAPSPPRRR